MTSLLFSACSPRFKSLFNECHREYPRTHENDTILLNRRLWREGRRAKDAFKSTSDIAHFFRHKCDDVAFMMRWPPAAALQSCCKAFICQSHGWIYTCSLLWIPWVFLCVFDCCLAIGHCFACFSLSRHQSYAAAVFGSQPFSFPKTGKFLMTDLSLCCTTMYVFLSLTLISLLYFRVGCCLQHLLSLLYFIHPFTLFDGENNSHLMGLI